MNTATFRSVRALGVLALLAMADPVPPAPDWVMEGGEAKAQFGSSLAAGDVNFDGFDDLLVASSGDSGAGLVQVFLGSAQGLASTAQWQYGGHSKDSFGAAIAIGDVNGDGFDDVVVGSPFHDAHPDMNVGRIYLFFGGPAGLGYEPLTFIGDQESMSLGSSLCIGDVNGDRYGDVIAGAPRHDQVREEERVTDTGRVFVFHGDSSDTLLDQPDLVLDGVQADALFGAALATGDIDGDGVADLAVGTPFHEVDKANEGVVFLFPGRTGEGLPGAPSWTITGGRVDARLGDAVVFLDANLDGYGDVISGAPGYRSDEDVMGAVLAHHGSPSGPPPHPDWIVALGATALSGAGDRNGDGFADLAVGTEEADGQNVGRVVVFEGGAGGLSRSPAWTVDGEQPNEHFGVSVASGDFNADSFGDLAVGSPWFTNPEPRKGRVVVFHGRRILALGLEQLRRNGRTPIPAGDATPESGFVARAVVVDSDGGDLVLEVEAAEEGVDFSGEATAAAAAVPAGGTASVTVRRLAYEKGYRWRARVRNEGTGRVSSWIRFGGDSDGADFVVGPNELPRAERPGQWERQDGRSIPAGGAVEGDRVALQVAITDANGDDARVDLEVRRVGEDYTGSPTAGIGWIAAGSAADVDLQLPFGSYRWRFRAVGPAGESGEWVEFGGNGAGEADFRILGGSFSSAPCAALAHPACLSGLGVAGIIMVAWILNGRRTR